MKVDRSHSTQHHQKAHEGHHQKAHEKNHHQKAHEKQHQKAHGKHQPSANEKQHQKTRNTPTNQAPHGKDTMAPGTKRPPVELNPSAPGSSSKGTVAPGSAPSTPTTPGGQVGNVAVPSQNLTPGTHSADVQQLQNGLVKLGYMTQDQMNTGPGIYGPRTQNAISALQARNGLPVTGALDDATRAAMSKEAGQLSNPSDMVKDAYQKMLNRDPTPAELASATANAAAIRDQGGSLASMRQGLSSQIRQTPEYKQAHPVGSGTVNNTQDANQYFLTQWGGTQYNSAHGAPAGYNDCGPTSGVMALSALGLMDHPDPAQAEAAIGQMRDAALGHHTTQSAEMGFGNVAQGLHSFGAQTQMLKGGIPSIDAALDRGNPVIIGGDPWQAWGKSQMTAGNYLNYRDPGGHFVTLLGKTSDGNYVVGDPLVKNGTLSVSADQLKSFLGGGFGAMEVSRP